MAGVDDSMVRLRDSAEIDSSPRKNRKLETNSNSTAQEDLPPGSFFHGGKLLRVGDYHDQECIRQCELFCKQFEESEGFDVDWDSFDYVFSVVNFHWKPYLDDKLTNDELLKLLIQRAIEEHDEENGTKLELIDYVGANIVSCKGLMYYITFWAKDVSSTNPEPQLYQAKLRRFIDDISVKMVREKPKKVD